MNNYKALFAPIIIAAMLFAGCDGEKKMETEDGFEYVVVSSAGGEPLREGEFVTYSLKMVDQNDSVLIDSEEVGEMPIQINDSLLSKRGGLFSILKSLNEGDSIKTILTAGEVYSKGFRQPLSEGMKVDDRITVYAKAIQKFDSAGFREYQNKKREEMMAEMEAEMEAQKSKDEERIAAYLEANNIDAQRTESGLYYVITEAGEGPKPESGQIVRVHYTGKTLEGEMFDTSVEELAKANDLYNERREYGPIEIPIDRQRVIKGWDEGIMLLNEGTKATFYIPSGLAYGPRQVSEQIGANEVLIFDVELVEVVEEEN